MTASRPKPFVQEMGYRQTALGEALYVRIRTENYSLLGWRDVYDKFAEAYPGKWAVECFPPAEELVDDVNMYHLFVVDHEPQGLNINRR